MSTRIVVLIAVALVLAAPAYAQSARELTPADVEAARTARNEAAASLAEATARFERAVADEEFSRERATDLAASIAALEVDIAQRNTQVLELVRNRYMTGGTSGSERLFATRTFEDIPIQSEYFHVMSAHDHAQLRGLQAAKELHSDQKVKLDETLRAQEALVVEITGLRDEILETLERADADYTAIAAEFQRQEEERRRKAEEERLRREEEERRRREAAAAAAASTTTVPATTTTTSEPTSTTQPGSTTTTQPGSTTTTAPATTTTTTNPPAPPPVVTDGKTCPINAATTFSDTWGAPRSGGRTHKGVDMIAVRNAPLVAIESGVITRISNSSLGGRSIYLTGTSGARYYYAHLESFAPGVGGGTSVSVGDLVGYNGSSGNAPDYLPHLHFQYAPPGSDWVNPYPLVRALC